MKTKSTHTTIIAIVLLALIGAITTTTALPASDYADTAGPLFGSAEECID